MRVFRAGLFALLLYIAATLLPTLAHADPLPRERVPEISLPVSPVKLSAKFGESGSYWGGVPHSGLDFDGNTGDPIYAVAAGVVREVATRGSYGRTITIAHGDGVASMYAHLASTEVKVVQQVKSGERIAQMGATGNVSGSHLHLEIQLRGAPTDPYGFLFAANPGSVSEPPGWACRIYGC